MSTESTGRYNLSEEKWRELLSPDQFQVLREKGTDPPFEGQFVHPGPDGTYHCAGCGAELFDAERQFDSGSGWPSFTAPADDGAVELHEDLSLGTVRTEVTCARCGGHLGHLFDDGPEPNGQRWCINGTSLTLDTAADA